MRVSVVPGDRGYRKDASSFAVEVDGRPVQTAITADEEQGLVVALLVERNPSTGEVRMARDASGEPRTEEIRGSVKIRDTRSRAHLTEPKVKVERNLDGLLEVLVYSQIKQGHIRRTVIDAKTLAVYRNKGGDAFCVSVCAGAAAEHLCQALGDLFDPSDVAKAASEAYASLQALEQGALH